MKTYRIILVENDEDEQFFMREGFEKAGGFDIVQQVKNGDELFGWMQANPDNRPDLILSDLNMPGKNGFDILREVKSDPRYSSLPVIITSTSSTRTIIDKCLAAGASDYIVKPDTFIEYVPYVQKLHKLVEAKKLVK